MSTDAAIDAPLPPDHLTIRRATTLDEFAGIVEVRRQVFRDEQAIVDTMLTDSDDPDSIHVYGAIGERIVAAGRMTPPTERTPEAQIAWVATLPAWRGQGIATAIMEELLAIADREGYTAVLLSAQTHALHFYGRLGFTPYGRRFDVRGIEHQYMERRRAAQ